MSAVHVDKLTLGSRITGSILYIFVVFFLQTYQQFIHTNRHHYQYFNMNLLLKLQSRSINRRDFI